MGTWVFSPKAKASLADSNARLNFWHGSVRSGKTISSIIRWLTYIKTAPEGHLVMVGKTERTLKRNVLDEIERIVGSRSYRYVGGAGEVWIFGRRVLLLGANDARAEGKARGLTAAGIYGDEITLWPEGLFKQLLARMSVRGAMLFGTTNPDGPYHWLKVGYLDRRELDMRVWHFDLDDNPALDPAYVASLKLEYGEGSLWYRRFIEGQWVAAEGAVFDFFDEREHVIPELPKPPEELFLSVDYGTSNATSASLNAAWRTGPLKAARLRAYYHSGAETGRQKTDAEYADDLDTTFGDVKARVQRVILDPSAASFKVELRRRGWRVLDADNSVLDGLRTHARMLKSGEYRIVDHPSNKQVIRDYGAYLWDAKAQARGEDKPLKVHDHALDESRYFLHTVFGNPPPSQAAQRALRAW